MKVVFVDAAYWIATVDPHDQHQSAAIMARKVLRRARFVTTEEVLVEVFSGLTRASQPVRVAAVRLVRQREPIYRRQR